MSASTSPRRSIDVSRLPDISLDSSALLWWATAGLIVIESTGFAILLATGIYLRFTDTDWPPPTVAPPDLARGVAGLLLLLASCLPFRAAQRVAGRGRPKEDCHRIAAWLGVFLLITAAFLAVRFLEFRGTHVRWNHSAYASYAWTVLGLHLLEALAGFFEVLVIVVVLLGKEVEEKHLLDVRACGLFWFFVALSWVPLFVMLYVFPRLT